MFGMLLIVAQWWIESQPHRSIHRCTPYSAGVVQPAWKHATPVGADEEPPGPPLLTAAEAARFIEGIPPSPAILNAQGWKNAAAVFGSSFNGPHWPLDLPVDRSNDPKDLSPVTDEVAELIAKWEKAAAPSPKFYEFRRITYDLSRQVETRAKGAFVYESPGQGAFHFDNEPLNSRSVSQRKDPEGNRFVIEAGPSEEWTWSEQEILHIHKTNKTYSIAPLPKATNEESSDFFLQTIESRAPFIINVRDAVMRREWTFTQLSRIGYQCILEAIPRTAARRRDFSKCLIRLDTESGRPTAIKYVSADQVHETVYVIYRVRKFTRIEGCRFPSRHVRLKGYCNVPMTPQ